MLADGQAETKSIDGLSQETEAPAEQPKEEATDEGKPVGEEKPTEKTDDSAPAQTQPWETVQAMIEKLPDAETVRAWMESSEAHEDERMQLQADIEALMEAMAALAPEEYERLDLTKLAALTGNAEALADTS